MSNIEQNNFLTKNVTGLPYINDYDEDFNLLIRKEEGISRFVYKYYKPWLIYDNVLYLYSPKTRLWEEQFDNIFALVNLRNLIDQVMISIFQKIENNIIVSKENDKTNVIVFENQRLELNKVMNLLCKNALKFAITKSLIAILQSNSDPNFQGFNRLAYYLAVPNNKVVNMKTGEILNRLPEHYFSTETTVEYIPGFHNVFEPFYEIMSAFTLEDNLLENEKVVLNFLQETMGYCASGAADRKLVFILFGEGENGKSEFVKLFMEILGCVFTCLTRKILYLSKNYRFVAIHENKFRESEIQHALGDDRSITTFMYDETQLSRKRLSYENANRVLCIKFRATFKQNPTKPDDRKTSPEIRNIMNSVDFKKAYLSWIIEGTKRAHLNGYTVPECVKYPSIVHL